MGLKHIEHFFFFLQEFIENFSETRPCVLSRSLAQVLYLGGDKLWGGQAMAEALREAARGFICPPALLLKAPVMTNTQVQAIYKIL